MPKYEFPFDTPRPVLWRSRNDIMKFSRSDGVVSALLHEAGEIGLSGDACFVFLACELVKERTKRDQKDALSAHFREVQEARIKYLEARNSGSFSNLINRIKEKLTWRKA